jgi:hypothetical protein
MKLFGTIVLWMLTSFFSDVKAQENISFFRSHFEKASSEADFQQLLDTEISDTSAFNVNVIKSYKSVCHSAMAQFVFSPYTKYKMFHEGKKQLEIAILTQASVENIFLRLIVQLNTPSFLGYSSDIESDLKFLQTNLERAPVPLATKRFIVKTIIETDNHNYALESLSLLNIKEII